ncbi:peptidase inhibitor family I36 protein [Longispora albida]|uniref:peptidase inhibitor family I36 protein n=1 Tax=Longispora albida TaxID=203523 RepID=UPI0003AB1D56|nr:peptidase inhibitor family I36 protein [Longispora albida]
MRVSFARRTMLSFAAITALVVPAVVVGTASPSLAWRANSICIAQDRDGGRNSFCFTAGTYVPELNSKYCGSCWGNNWNDEMSSWYSTTSMRYCWYFDANYGGESHVMDFSHQRWINQPGREDNKASSLRPC